MKQHKTIFTVATMLLMAGGMFTACTNDDLSSVPVPEGNSESKVYTLCISTQKSGDASQRVLAEDGEVIRSTWATTDKVYVKKGDSWFIGELQPQSAGVSTTLSGQIAGMEIAAGDVLTLQYLKKGDMNYDGQVGTLADISENFNYATAEVTVSTVDSEGNVYLTESSADFKNQQAILKLTLQDEDGNDINAEKISLYIRSSEDLCISVTPTSATDEFYVAIPASDIRNLRLLCTDSSMTYIGEPQGWKGWGNGKFSIQQCTMQSIIMDDGDSIKVYTSGFGGYKVSKQDYGEQDNWEDDISWGLQEQWKEILILCGGYDNCGYYFLNDAVNASGITGWTPMENTYWTATAGRTLGETNWYTEDTYSMWGRSIRKISSFTD